MTKTKITWIITIIMQNVPQKAKVFIVVTLGLSSKV